MYRERSIFLYTPQGGKSLYVCALCGKDSFEMKGWENGEGKY